MSAKFKDLFSRQAAEYARYRPRYPKELFEFLVSLAPGRALAWDCATGSGQVAMGLVPYFEKVVATDPNENQLAHAPRHPRISYQKGSAEQSPLEDKSADLITVAQAIHWFDFEGFYAEVRRVLRPGGILAVWNYGHDRRMDSAVNTIVLKYFSHIVGPFWPPEIRYVLDKYRTIPFPFKEIKPPPLQLEVRWDLAQLIGYLYTWSATQKFIESRGFNPLERIEPELKAAWGPPERKKKIAWDISLRVGRVGGYTLGMAVGAMWLFLFGVGLVAAESKPQERDYDEEGYIAESPEAGGAYCFDAERNPTPCEKKGGKEPYSPKKKNKHRIKSSKKPGKHKPGEKLAAKKQEENPETAGQGSPEQGADQAAKPSQSSTQPQGAPPANTPPMVSGSVQGSAASVPSQGSPPPASAAPQGSPAEEPPANGPPPSDGPSLGGGDVHSTP